MSTEPQPAVSVDAISEAVFQRIKDSVEEKIQSAVEKVAGEIHLKAESFVSRDEFSGLTGKLEDFKNEVVKIAGQVEEVTKRLNMAFEEIRSVGGRQLERVPPEPAKKAGKALTLLEFEE